MGSLLLGFTPEDQQQSDNLKLLCQHTEMTVLIRKTKYDKIRKMMGEGHKDYQEQMTPH